jgi:hypothetical protein
MSIPTMPADSAPALVADALDEAGCVVVTGLFDESDRTAVSTELAPYMASVPVIETDDPTRFYPARTRRKSALVARSAAVGKLVLDGCSLGLCDYFLTPNSELGYQLHVSAALEVGPGARRQVLHREHDSFSFFSHPRPNMIVASMWAITDFRADNGGTLIVPGSHKWPAEREATEGEITAAEMPAGSVLYWLGGTLHGAGANSSNDWRYGVILTYSLGWLRQEENQYLNVPPEDAEKLSPQLRNLIGYKMHGALGFSLNREVGETPS